MTADLIAFVRAAGGQVTNRMSLELCDHLESAQKEIAWLKEQREHLMRVMNRG